MKSNTLPRVLAFAVYLLFFSTAPAVDVATTSQEQFLIEIQDAQTGGALFNLVEAAFSSRRMDLVRVCFSAPRATGAFTIKLEEEPSSIFKNDVVLMILAMPWPSDPRPGRPLPMGSMPPPSLERICIETLAPLLPGEGLSVDDPKSLEIFSSASSRRALAEKLKLASREPSSPPAQEKRSQKARESLSVSPASLPAKNAAEVSPSRGSQHVGNQSHWLWIGGGVVVVLTLTFFVLRLKKN